MQGLVRNRCFISGHLDDVVNCVSQVLEADQIDGAGVPMDEGRIVFFPCELVSLNQVSSSLNHVINYFVLVTLTKHFLIVYSLCQSRKYLCQLGSLVGIDCVLLNEHNSVSNFDSSSRNLIDVDVKGFALLRLEPVS